MGNRRGDFRPDKLSAIHCYYSGEKWIGYSGVNAVVARTHNRRQRQYNRDLIARELENWDETAQETRSSMSNCGVATVAPP